MSRWLRSVLVLAAACTAPPTAAPPANVASPLPTTSPASIAVQLSYRGTFAIGPPFSQVPPFTLLDDGTLIGAKSGHPPFTATLPRDEVARIVQRVKDLGFDRLASYTEHCSRLDPIKQTRICVSDAAYTNLRVGAREVSTYAEFSNEPAAHRAIVAYLEAYQPARTAPYRPTSGVLHVRLDHAPRPAACATIDPAHLGKPPADREMWGLRIEGAALDAVLAIANQRTTFFACAGDRLYQLAFLPAVPGFDLSTELDPYRR